MTIYIIDSQYDGVMHDKYFTTLEKANAYLVENNLEKYCYVTPMGAN